MNSYADQIRALAQRLQDYEEVPLEFVVVTLMEAAEKIDYLGELLESYSNVNIS